jgi:predicted permease
MSIAVSILPILLTILCGYLIAASGILPRGKWDGINTLTFRILIPAMLVHSIAVSDLSGMASGAWIWALLITLAATATAVLALRAVVSPVSLPNPAFTTLFQATTRWNAFVALAAAEQFIGTDGLALLALGMAIMVPIINIGNIVVLVAFGTARADIAAVVRSTVQNPLVIGCAIGLTVNLTGIALPDPLLDSIGLVGRATLGMGLMAVGAGIVLERLFASSWKVWLGVGLRLVFCPLVFAILALGLQLHLDEALAGVLMFAVPAAANGYVIAQRMGGDADLYADILTWQTVLALGCLPAWAIAMHWLF